MADCVKQAILDKLFPPERANEFFDAIYGGTEEGAYDIKLVCDQVEEDKASFAFQLIRRENQCLKCSLTYGLPGVFLRHPVINIQKVTADLAEKLGWKDCKWQLEPVQELSDDLHIIPLILERQ